MQLIDIIKSLNIHLKPKLGSLLRKSALPAGLSLFGLSGCSGADIIDGSQQLKVVTEQMVVTRKKVISGRHFKCEGKPYQALVVTGDNVTIKDNLFTDCYAGIILVGAANTTVSGNRFENVGVAIREKDWTTRSVITHNEFEGVGTYSCSKTPEWGYHVNGYWACDVYQSVNGQGGKFNRNIISNQGFKTRWIEDFVNIFGAGGGFEVKENLFIGSSEPNSSSSSGGCIVVDGLGKNYLVEGNRCYNVAAYGIGNAGGNDVVFRNNTVYLTQKHVLTLTQHPRNRGTGGSYSFASTRYNGPCGKNVLMTGNKAFSHEVNLKNGQSLIDRKRALNLMESCPVTLENNQFLDTDPGWEIPSGVFDNLGPEYFSGRRSSTQQKPIGPSVK